MSKELLESLRFIAYESKAIDQRIWSKEYEFRVAQKHSKTQTYEYEHKEIQLIL